MSSTTYYVALDAIIWYVSLCSRIESKAYSFHNPGIVQWVCSEILIFRTQYIYNKCTS